jgi:dTDP-4-dehydrorhamnose reductase
MRATPGLASENAKLILQIAHQDRQGVYHCCAGEAVSRLELAHIIADVFESDAGLINTGPPPPDDPAALIGYPVPRDTSLDANRSASILGYALPSVRKLIENYQHEVTTGTLPKQNRTP